MGLLFFLFASFNNPYTSSHYNQSYQSYSPHHERTIHSTTILGGSVADPRASNSAQMSSGAKQGATQSSIPGAPPVNRLVDMLNKPTFGLGTGLNNTSAILTPNENRNNKFGQDFYSSENRSIVNQQDYSCKGIFLKFQLFFIGLRYLHLLGGVKQS